MHEIAGFGIRNVSGSRQAEKIPVYSGTDVTGFGGMARGKAARSQTGQIATAMGSAILAICLASGTAVAQQQEQPKQDQTKQNIPDAPSASRPFPGAPPPSSSNPAPPPASQAPPPNQPPPKESVEEPVYAPGVAPAPPFN